MSSTAQPNPKRFKVDASLATATQGTLSFSFKNPQKLIDVQVGEDTFGELCTPSGALCWIFVSKGKPLPMSILPKDVKIDLPCSADGVSQDSILCMAFIPSNSPSEAVSFPLDDTKKGEEFQNKMAKQTRSKFHQRTEEVRSSIHTAMSSFKEQTQSPDTSPDDFTHTALELQTLTRTLMAREESNEIPFDIFGKVIYLLLPIGFSECWDAYPGKPFVSFSQTGGSSTVVLQTTINYQETKSTKLFLWEEQRLHTAHTRGFAVDSDFFYVTNSGTKSLEIFSRREGQLLATIAHFPVVGDNATQFHFNDPCGIHVEEYPTRTVIVVDRSQYRIVELPLRVVDSSSNQIVPGPGRILFEEYLVAFPVGVACEKDLLAVHSSTRVSFFDRKKSKHLSFIGGFNNITDVALREEFVYIADNPQGQQSRVLIFDYRKTAPHTVIPNVHEGCPRLATGHHHIFLSFPELFGVTMFNNTTYEKLSDLLLDKEDAQRAGHPKFLTVYDGYLFLFFTDLKGSASVFLCPI